MKTYLTLLLILFYQVVFAQESRVEIKYLNVNGNTIAPFSVENNSKNLAFLKENKIKIKNITKRNIYFTSTTEWLVKNKNLGNISDFHFEAIPPEVLNDSSRQLHFVNQVHQGSGGLSSAYKGKDVIVGVIDVGLDVTHPDFKDSLGKSRVIRYWDQTYSGVDKFAAYEYGKLWDSTAINNNLFSGSDPVASGGHGTSVTGRAAGNGLSVGDNEGNAPESDIVFVQSYSDTINWTLTIADACDYIFKYADSVGKPAVINISMGIYLGSHDGNDPASELMEQLVDEHPGRIIVCAAGNSGNFGRIHVRGTASADTSFVWWQNNPNPNFFGLSNKIYMDIWTDTTDARLIDFALGADKPSPSYGFRGRTNFYNMKAIAGTVQYDTIYNSNHQRIATVELYPEFVDSAFHLEVYFSNVDSTSYYYRFMTKGTGSYDAWGATNNGIKTNNMISTLPSVAVVPEITKYQLPDFTQSIVSSFNCSGKIISVGNVKNRNKHTNKNGVVYTSTSSALIGELVSGSSKGPNRHNLTKPDFAATGEFGISPVPSWKYTNSGYNASVDINGYQGRNNGTSMASPTLAGIAALYLEKCKNASYQNFKEDLKATAIVDNFTGVVPNNSYGYGKPHALNLLLGNNTASILGNTGICSSPISLSTSISSSIDSVVWMNSSNSNNLLVSTQDTVSAIVYYGNGCHVKTDTAIVILNSLPMIQGETGLCDSSIVLHVQPTTLTDSIIWNTGFSGDSLPVNVAGNYQSTIYYASGCSMSTPMTTVVQNTTSPISGNTGVCNDTITLVEHHSGLLDSLVWNNSNTTNSIDVHTAGNYWVKYYFSSGCTMNSDTSIVISNSLPTIQGNVGICSQPAPLNVDPISVYDSIVWNNGTIGDTALISTSGIYSATIYYSTGCSMETVSENVVLNEKLGITGNTGLCLDTITLLSNYNGNIDSLVWNTTDQTTAISTSIPGIYFVTYYFSSGCTLTDSTTVLQKVVLPNPVITENGNFLISSIAPNYQWTINGSPLSSETNDTLLLSPVVSGNYSVSTTSADGCISTSNIILIQASLEENDFSNTISIFPNPTNGEFRIISELNIESVKLYDSQGKEINMMEIKNKTFNIQSLNSGVYSVEISTAKGKYHSKIIKQ